MMFSQLEDTRDVLFSILQDRSLPLTLRMSASEQLTEQYQIRVEEQKEYEIDELLRSCEALHQRKKLQEFVSESLAEKGIDAASLHRWARQIEEFKYYAVWNACVRNGMMCWMVLKSGCIREVRKPIIKFAKNFIRHMEA